MPLNVQACLHCCKIIFQLLGPFNSSLAPNIVCTFTLSNNIWYIIKSGQLKWQQQWNRKALFNDVAHTTWGQIVCAQASVWHVRMANAGSNDHNLIYSYLFLAWIQLTGFWGAGCWGHRARGQLWKNIDISKRMTNNTKKTTK